jgi:hypothetical protein
MCSCRCIPSVLRGPAKLPVASAGSWFSDPSSRGVCGCVWVCAFVVNKPFHKRNSYNSNNNEDDDDDGDDNDNYDDDDNEGRQRRSAREGSSGPPAPQVFRCNRKIQLPPLVSYNPA